MGLLKKLKKIPQWFHSFLNYMKRRKYMYFPKELKDMRINIIIATKEKSWILGKFADCVSEQLNGMGIKSIVTGSFDQSADINHYFLPNFFEKVDEHTTFMVTHVDTALKMDQVKYATSKGAVGICMSKETRDRLISYGVPANRICYIHPAQDGQIRPRKILLGITHRVYKDNRKRESMLIDVFKQVNTDLYKLVIMGAGWEDVISELTKLGLEIEYYPEFDKEKYNDLMTRLDYYCYFGFDEGSMGYLDAVAAGVGTIVTPQGYHLDTKAPITYPVSTVDEVVDALHEIGAKNERSIQFAKDWTWETYTKKHLELWKYMLQAEPMEKILSTRGLYVDGIYSLLLDNIMNSIPLNTAVKRAVDATNSE